MSDDEWDFFISHSGEDRAVVGHLVADLESPPYNLRCCVSYREFNRPTMNSRLYEWDKMINFGVKRSKQFILVLTENAIESPHVQKEIRLADSSRKSMRLVRLQHSKVKIDEAITRVQFEQYLKYPQWLPYFLDPVHADLRRQTIETLAATAGRNVAELALAAKLMRRQRELAEEHENGQISDQIEFPVPGIRLDLMYIPRPDDTPQWWRGHDHGFYVSARPISNGHILAMKSKFASNLVAGALLFPKSIAEEVLDFIKHANSSRLWLLSPAELKWALAPDATCCDGRNPFGLNYDASIRVAWCWREEGLVAADPLHGPTDADVAAIWLRR